MRKLRKICGNCTDYNKEQGICNIRFTIQEDHKTLKPMKRTPTEKGCSAFINKH